MFKFRTSGLFACLSLISLVSCNDYEGGFDLDSIKKASYAQDFEKTFGTPDPNQDWSMASTITANVNLAESVDGILSIYTKAPGLNGCYLLAKGSVKEGRCQICFDAIKGSNLLYARIEKEGRVLYASYHDVVKSSIDISEHINTRAVNTAVVDNVYVTTEDVSAYRMPKSALAAYTSANATSWSQLSYQESETMTRDYVNSTGDAPYQLNNMKIENLYRLNNQYMVDGAEYTMEQLWKIFGKKTGEQVEVEGVFQEKENHIDKYVKTGILQKDASLVVAEDGEVSMEIIWRGTQYDDIFGYYIYPSSGVMTAEEIWSAPKYILFGGIDALSINKQSTLTEVNYYNEWTNSYGEWNQMNGEQANYIVGDPKTKMRGTKMNLVNFDANGTPSYEFKKGTKIGFFLFTTHSNKMYLSDTKLSYQLNYEYYEHNNDNADMTRPFAVSFNYKGSTLLGFGDGCNDYDLNDVVFGAFNVEEVPDITPEEPEPEAITWMVACEDLGGTFDYDFNDLVFGLRKTPNLDASKSTLELVPFAAGGTLEAHILYEGADKGEIHALLGGTNTSSIINATAGSSPNLGTAVTLDRNIDSNVSINDLAVNKISVKVQSDGASNIFLTKGDSYDGTKAPQMILFQAGWDWPSEGVDIRDAYPDFAGWVTNSTNVDWYKNMNKNYGYVNCPLAKATTDGGYNGSTSGTGVDSPIVSKQNSYEINLTECTEYNGKDWQGIQIQWGYAVEFSSVNFEGATQVTLKIIADQDLSLALQSNKSWSSCNHEFVGGSASTNNVLTFNSVPSSWTGVYFQTNVSLTNAKAIITVTK